MKPPTIEHYRQYTQERANVIQTQLQTGAYAPEDVAVGRKLFFDFYTYAQVFRSGTGGEVLLRAKEYIDRVYGHDFQEWLSVRTTNTTREDN